ncbi:hypothetical protein T552_03175 [Pneumocystis carinii B80]|uniref:RRM domain-containing protein n=1 Tax=Pneumocystis carinii (strain B80) TaxID=1408658 RepID=A0A0W4ZBY4_PNEC8|nr:hypothetical protein T552_03175 [Pneumocystis carinii B80]KTW25901.1 hypothetical protein T552_03175 [Pneumocystis carinii B80]
MHDEHKDSVLEHHETNISQEKSTSTNNKEEDVGRIEGISEIQEEANQQDFGMVVPPQHLAASPFISHTSSVPAHGLSMSSYAQNSPGNAGYGEVRVPGLLEPQFPIFPHFYGNISILGDAHKLGRTIYIGNIPSETTVNEILSQVRTGPIESVRLLPDKNCAFISFLEPSPAALFYEDAIMKKLSFHGKEAKIGWGKPSSVSSTVMLAVQQSGATRNVYLGNLQENITEEEIKEDLSKFGTIDQIKIVKNKGICFVHFLSISNAMKAVQQLPMEHKWANRKISYGKDRCAQSFRYHSTIPHDPILLNNLGMNHLTSQMNTMNLVLPNYTNYHDLGHSCVDSHSIIGNRTVYLGNIHPETTVEEICNVIRGGILHNIKYFPEKHICFVTFVNPASAMLFYNISVTQGLIIHNRKLKVGFGKHSGLLPSSIAIAVTSGATRNIYIGNTNENITVVKLKKDFSEWGEVELVNMLREKNCAFVNFTNISDALKAIEGIKTKEDYKKFKINFGKDRCGNPPKQIINQNDHIALSQPRITRTGFNMFHPSPDIPFTANIMNVTHSEEKFVNEIPYYTNYPPTENNGNIDTCSKSLSPILYDSTTYNDSSTNNGKNNQLIYEIIHDNKINEAN